ncbi:MAG: homocysteine S-methyltransferase family protein, partial [Planctomycetes bacterium]|nr:homocysteine S-methyltransferase family protein [Planctomycetota bacterium]
MAKQSLTDRLQHGILIGDGAMGTMLYQYGVFLNTCFDELSLTRPDLISKTHAAYIGAGCDFIETNTFGANAFKLAKFGLADKIETINETAVTLAKDAAGDSVLVAGSIGPSGTNNPNPNEELTRDLTDAFATQSRSLTKAGADFLLLETFTNATELQIAIEAAGETDLPIVAQMTCTDQFETFFGTPIEKAIAEVAAHEAVVAVGLNCSLGPSDMLEALRRLREVTHKPISIQPNAGLPRQVEGRTLYMCTPEYMAEYAKRFFESGARIIGGCCGTTPAHIAEIVKTVRSLAKAMT